MTRTDGISSLGEMLVSLSSSGLTPSGRKVPGTSQPQAYPSVETPAEARLAKVARLQRAIAASAYKVAAGDLADRLMEHLLRSH